MMNNKVKRFIVVVAPFVLMAALIVCASYAVNNLRLPRCFFYTVLHFHCPGCGMIRACESLLRGDILLSLRNNFMFIGGIVLGALYYLEYALKVFGKKVNFKFLHNPKFIYGFLIFLGVFYVLRNFIPEIAPISEMIK